MAPFVGLTPEQLVNSDAVGRDWIEAGDNQNASLYFLDRNENIPNHPTAMMTGFQETVDSLNAGNLPPLNTPRRVYVGGLTLRQITDEVTGRLATMPQLLGRTDITGAQQNHPLTDLRLRGWFGKGFSTITRFHPDGNNPARNFDRVIDLETISQRLKTRHPRRIRDRIPGIDVPGHFDYEPCDSSFVDITVHEVVGESMDNTFVVGVLNRRTDPRMLQTGLWHQIDNTLADNERWGFVTHDMWLDSIDLNENRRFVQRGAREITLPFEYKPADGRYKMLRLQEMGGGIDTIIGQDKELAINFLPGEGKMFRVTVMPGEVVNDLKGWLSHNTQRKAVVFPSLVGGTFAQRYETVNRTRPNCANMMEATVTSFVRAREGANFRYHVVYHMRAGAQEDGYLTVYYRRSEPLWFFPNDATTTDEGGIYNPEIVWEDPIPLNQIERAGQILTPPPSCGYPSLVVRESPNIAPLATNPLVYVVYGCEGNLPNEILICEAQLPANTSSVTQINHYGLKRSVVLSTAFSDNTCALESADRLRYWGTPVVNASLNGNFYAWSDYNNGIVVGFKRPELRYFDPNAGIAELKFSDDPHVRAQYPSMHSYSKLALGEEDCSLVWQEGPAQTCAAGTGIYYSRLHSDSIGVFPLLSPSGNLGFAAGALPTNNDQTILYVSSDPYVAAPSVNEKPTLYRNLSEFDDADMEPTNPLIAIGYQNHKAERIAWEHRHYPIGNPNYLTNNSRMIIRSSIDVTDFCAPPPGVTTTVFWQSAIGRIFSVGVDLINPELIQGEQKTTFAHDTLTTNAARSWMAGDTSVVLSFNSEHGYGGLPQVYHMTFAGGYHLAGDVNMELTSTQFSDAAINVSLADGLVGRRGGRVPHVSARHNITRSQSFLKNRRIFENAIGETPIQGYAPAPDVDRTAQGFFKRREQIESEADRVFRGFRSQQTSALLADIRIDGKLILLSSDRALPQEARKGVRTLYTDWFRSIELSDLELRSIPSGNSATRASAWIERRSDGEKLFLPVLNVTGANPGAKIAPSQKHEWKLLTDTKEEYRIALTCIDEDAMVAEDIEINSGMSDKLFAKTNVDQEELPTTILNLRRMEEWTVASMTSGSVQVFPMPATQEASMVITNIPAGRKRCNATISNAQGELIQSVSFDARLESSAILDFSVASLAPGMYTIKIDGTSLVGTFIVAR
ncbi:MAG: T9SS type A sorting domain-containing protein [Ignavibacteria bacterium]|nr:T9SS type A sorting domain-containing protein [Ignavibacteria bacterium]